MFTIYIMGLYSDYIAANGENSGRTIPNIEWALKTIDTSNSKLAPINATLTDAAESSTLPATTSTAITTLLQTIRNNLKWLINNKENLSNKKTALTNSDTDYPTTKAVINAIYPVGSIYMSVNNTNPGTYFSGTTWVAWGSGRVPVGVNGSDGDFNSVEKTGGSKTATNTSSGGGTSGSTVISLDQMPKHNHSISGNISANDHNHTVGQETWKIGFRKMGGTSDDNAGTSSSILVDTGCLNVDLSNKSVGYYFTSVGSGDQRSGAHIVSHTSAISVGNVSHSHNFTNGSIGETGGNQGHTHSTPDHQHTVSILQPYITCYMWKRTA